MSKQPKTTHSAHSKASCLTFRPACRAPGYRTKYAYDEFARLTNVTSSAGPFGYQYAAITAAGESTAASVVGELDLPNAAYIANSYDDGARLLSTVLYNSSTTMLNSNGYVYDFGSQRTQQVFTAGNYVNYTYDNIGQLNSAVGYEPGGTFRLNDTTGYSYDAAGNLHNRSPNATVVNFFKVNNLNELTTETNAGTITVSGVATSAATNVTVNGMTAALYVDHTFAKAGFALTDGTNTFTAIATDSYGRWDTNTITCYLPKTNFFCYDLNGNMRTNANQVLEYDDENELTAVTVSNAWRSEFIYDGLMRRRIRREYAWQSAIWNLQSEIHYVCDGVLVIQERDGNNLPAVTYARGTDLSGTFEGAGGIGGLLARTDNHLLTINDPQSTALYHADGSGNITALVNPNQILAGQYHYDPYGNTISTSGPLAEANAYRFSSKEMHANSETYYYGYRSYAPSLQRWANRDPIEESGGLNGYAFVGNSPISLVDPVGLSTNDVNNIINTSQSIINQMTRNGERVNPLWNDLRAHFVKKGKACGAQADTVLGALVLKRYDDDWIFSQVRVIHPSIAPFHQFVMAKSSDPKDPVLLIDPYYNKIRPVDKKETYPGILLDSDSYRKPAGDHGTTCDSMSFY